MRYEFGGLMFGAAYTWRGLFSEFYGTLIFYQMLSTSFLKKCRENSLENLHVAVVDPGERAPPYFWTKLRPKGPKKFFGETAPPPPPPPLSKGLDDPTPTPLPSYFKVWIQHRVDIGFY